MGVKTLYTWDDVTVDFAIDKTGYADTD